MDQHLGSQLTAYADGTLTADDAVEVAAHLATCGACREMLDDLLAVRTLLHAVHAPEPHPAVLPQTLARLDRRRGSYALRKWIAVAAATAAAALLLQIPVMPPLHDPGTSVWYFQQHAQLSSIHPMADMTLSSYLGSALPYASAPQPPGVEESP